MSATPWLKYVDAITRPLRTHILQVRLGIAATLGISFVAVAVLAVTANFIVERGLSLVETLEQRNAFTPAPARPIAIISATQVADTRVRLLTDTLALAIDRYEHAVRNRAENSDIENAVEVARSADALEHALHDLAASGFPAPAIQRKLATYRDRFSNAGEELIAMTDARGAIYADYRGCLENMQARIHKSIDSSWNLFGRVFARRSLIALNGLTETLGRQAARVFNNEANERGAAIDETEHHILGALGSGDFKSQGEAWVQAMHTDMNELVRLRSAVQSLDESRHTLMNEFTTTAVSLKASTRSLGQSAATVPTGSDTRQQTISQSSSSTHDAPTLTRRTTVPDRNPSAVVAWISGAVLLLLVVISLATVWSIVVPVRRMLHGTAQIANGNLSARLAPGGIKELHSLALSFNKMAEQLEIAQQVSRGHLQQLEARVEERTRQLRELALNDPLTSLPNRRHLFTMLEAALSDARLHGHHVGVLFLDIDNFKNINDSMGHAFGDRLLQGMARRLRETISADAFVSRLGGDEFTIVYPDVHDVHSIETAGWALVHAFQQSLAIDARELAVSVSVGASIYPTHGEDPDALLQAADTALFHAKSAGRRQLAVFSPELFEIAAKKFATEQGLRRALQRDEFELVFQPEFDVRTFEVSLVEALIRWRQADGRLAPPGEFLSIAEECGLITELNDWVLRAAIETAARWYHGPWPKARVAVNVSSRQLIDSNLVERIAMLLREYRVPASIIEIELTESVLQTGRGTLDALKQLRALGVSIALDDFGAGYSSLASLQELPLTRIKLDRSLIESIDTNARSLAIARTIITLCRSLGLDLTAEGIERQQQLVLLRAEGHLHVQGYYLARPMSKDHLLRALVELPRQFNNPAAECAPLHVAVS